MRARDVDELKTLITAARTWQNQGSSVLPDPIQLTQINATIASKAVVLAWDPETSDWEVTAA